MKRFFEESSEEDLVVGTIKLNKVMEDQNNPRCILYWWVKSTSPFLYVHASSKYTVNDKHLE